MLLCYLQSPDMCNLLLENEAKIDKCDTRGWTPAMVATKEGNVVTLQLLIANGCNLEVQVSTK